MPPRRKVPESDEQTRKSRKVAADDTPNSNGMPTVAPSNPSEANRRSTRINRGQGGAAAQLEAVAEKFTQRQNRAVPNANDALQNAPVNPMAPPAKTQTRKKPVPPKETPSLPITAPKPTFAIGNQHSRYGFQLGLQPVRWNTTAEDEMAPDSEDEGPCTVMKEAEIPANNLPVPVPRRTNNNEGGCDRLIDELSPDEDEQQAIKALRAPTRRCHVQTVMSDDGEDDSYSVLQHHYNKNKTIQPPKPAMLNAKRQAHSPRASLPARMEDRSSAGDHHASGISGNPRENAEDQRGPHIDFRGLHRDPGLQTNASWREKKARAMRSNASTRKCTNTDEDEHFTQREVESGSQMEDKRRPASATPPNVDDDGHGNRWDSPRYNRHSSPDNRNDSGVHWDAEPIFEHKQYEKEYPAYEDPQYEDREYETQGHYHETQDRHYEDEHTTHEHELNQAEDDGDNGGSLKGSEEADDEGSVNLDKKTRTARNTHHHEADPTQLRFYKGPWIDVLNKSKRSRRLVNNLKWGFQERTAETLAEACGFIDREIAKHRAAGMPLDMAVYREHSTDMAILVFEDDSSNRGAMKSEGRKTVEAFYCEAIHPTIHDGHNSADVEAVRSQRVLDLLDDSQFHMVKDSQGRTENFGHPAIADLCHRFYYNDKPTCLGKLFPQDFKVLPRNCLALVLTCIINCLEEWQSGMFVGIAFTGKEYQEVYERMLELIEKVEDDPYHGPKLARLREKIGKTGSAKLRKRGGQLRRPFKVQLD